MAEAAGTARTMAELLRRQAARYEDKVAFSFSWNGDDEGRSQLTYRDLDIRARTIAVGLQRQGAAAGDRALVFSRPGLGFIAGFFGCIYAGVIPVPVHVRLEPRATTVVPDAQARFALATAWTRENRRAAVDELVDGPPLQWFTIDQIDQAVGDAESWVPPDVDADTPAMIQYTSGTTSAPKGIVVSHRNLLHTQVVDELAQLVDKSLVVADHADHTMRYWMLETIREYALEKLDESGDADAVRTRHRDHYTALADTQMAVDDRWFVEKAALELGNFRSAFAFSRRRGDVDLAARLTSSLQVLWFRGRTVEGLSWFDAVLADSTALAPATHACVLADKVSLAALDGDFSHPDHAQQAVTIARDLDDPALLARALAACGFAFLPSPAAALPYVREALELISALSDDSRLGTPLSMQAYSAFLAGDLAAIRAVAEKGQDLFHTVAGEGLPLFCRWLLAVTRFLHADLADTAAQFRKVAEDAQATHDPLLGVQSLSLLGVTLAYQGDISGARTAAEASIDAAADFGALQRSFTLGRFALTLLAAGDVAGAVAAADGARDACAPVQVLAISADPTGMAALASGDVIAARRWVDEALSVALGVHRIAVLATGVRAAIAEGGIARAELDAYEALGVAAEAEAYLSVPDVIECLAALATDAGNHREAAVLFGSAAGIRDRTGVIRFKIYDADYTAAVHVLRAALGDSDFEESWAEGTVLSTAEAVAHARRAAAKPSKRQRTSSGWDSLTATERNIAQVVGEGLSNKDVATRLHISVRTVESHLSHIYPKLGLSTRLQLVHEAARHF